MMTRDRVQIFVFSNRRSNQKMSALRLLEGRSADGSYRMSQSTQTRNRTVTTV